MFANVAAALVYSGVSASGVWWQFVVLMAAGVSAVVLTMMLRGTPGYVAGVLWALLAIAIGTAQRGSVMLSATAVIAAVCVAAAAAVALRRRGRAG